MASAVEELRERSFRYPGAYEDHPWGESVAKVDKKVFAFFGMADEHGRHTGFTVKLPDSSEAALMLPFVERTGYGLGDSGWVTVRPPEDWPLEPMLEWLDESYRAVARKSRIAELEADGPSETPDGGEPMATEKQREAARQNIKKAQQAAKDKRSIANLPKKTRTALGKQGAKVAKEKRAR